MLQYYDDDVIEALVHLFPDVKFDKSKFVIPRMSKLTVGGGGEGEKETKNIL
jgi:hypothetical protein